MSYHAHILLKVKDWTEKELDKPCGSNSPNSSGTILASPFNSRAEKEIRAEVEQFGANIILINC